MRLEFQKLCVYLLKCHHNSVSIVWKHLKCVFSFHNSSLKNQRIEWWKQNLKTNPNKLFLLDPTIFELWMIETKLWVMETQKPNSPLPFSYHGHWNLLKQVSQRCLGFLSTSCLEDFIVVDLGFSKFVV